MQYHNILRDYLRDYAVPAMLEQGWTFKAAKLYGWQKAQRGPAYHVDQPLRTHIINGLYALTRLLEYLKSNEYYHISETEFKRFLILFTMHDAYKDFELANTRMGNSDFSIPLQELDKLLERMRLRQFVSVKAEDIRAASVSLQSPKVADLASCTPGITHLLTLVHLADAFASQQTARDYKTAENRLREITRSDAITAIQNERMSKRTGIPIQDNDTKLPLSFYYHELDEYRGLSTLLIHQATEQILDKYGLYPILYFANAILYLGPEGIELQAEDLQSKVAANLFAQVRHEASSESPSIAREACDPRKGLKFEKYAFLFCKLEDLLNAAIESTALNNSSGFVSKLLANRIDKKKYAQAEDFYKCYEIPINIDETEALAKRWLGASKMVMAIENIAEALVPGNTIEWLFNTFNTPEQIATKVRQNIKLLRDGGVADHTMIVAYHWLVNTHFHANQRGWLEVETIDVQQTIAKRGLHALAKYDKDEHLLAFVEKELGFQSDVESYLRANLTFSFDPERLQEEYPLKEYEKERNQSHKRICVMCNRLITSKIDKKSTEIKTSVAEQQAQVFSNKRLPTNEVNNMMVWCPMCYLEFMLRKLSGQSYPAGSDYNASYRLYLYVLPDYSFTPQLWQSIGEELLQDNFYAKKTVVSKLSLRGGKDEPALPTQWLMQRTVDQGWLNQVSGMFADQAARLKMPNKEGKPRSKRGDRITFSFKSPNYMLITYDNVVAKSTDPGLLPTHIEVWTKALYAATLIHLLTGARVYITDKPYLSITRPEEMKTIIEMEGLHPLLYGLLPIRRTDAEFTDLDQRASESSARLSITSLEVMLDLLAAVWEVNAALYPKKPDEWRNLDKQVASVLEEFKTNYLAGATFYKMRERDKAAPYEAFTHACQILLPQTANQFDEVRRNLYVNGYELMTDKEGGDMMNLAQRITDACLKLYIPSAKQKGRAHRFETIFRTGVEAIKSNANIDDDTELMARVAGKILKRLERIKENHGYCPTYGNAQLETVKELSELLVKQLFSERCGHSVSKLTHEENHMADAIYFLTYQKVNLYWEEKRAKNGNNAVETDDEELDEIEV
ncbi:MAG TPA: type I-D CRISPR-associated protein Cas10d/Csc3 [Ktedonobacteraceae bacterium]|nr:type I-D CRISPR-associated protein Cas10d/Csc3 [Ktedonobacteraceae bacterium]